MAKPKTAITPTRAEDYPEWYQQVIAAADLAETSPVRGCMVIKPWGYAIWEHIQQELDRQFKATGHVNAYFPLLIPLSYLEREADHVEGFAKECAVVTHHRLEADEKGGLKPAGELEEPYVIRPTSETMIGELYSKWIQSYRDLPVLINQWANVMRWEMRTRMFLRTSEFLWQEGHTAHATSEEAIDETIKMSKLYADFAEEYLAMPVIQGEKTIAERFPGATTTYTIEAMMQDKKALQAGTSHFLGQNFSKAANIQFLDKSGEQKLVWTTSWGVSTRLIGGLIMTHSDDDGLILPPRVAPQQVIILPIFRNDEEEAQVMAFCDKVQQQLAGLFYHNSPVRVHIDKRDMRGGEKTWHWIKKGAPIRLEVGPRDVANESTFMGCRHLGHKDKKSLNLNELEQIPAVLEEIQKTLLERAKAFRAENTKEVSSLEEFKAYFENDGGFAICYAKDDPEIEKTLKPLKVSARCIPSDQDGAQGTCIFTGETVKHKIVFAKSY